MGDGRTPAHNGEPEQEPGRGTGLDLPLHSPVQGGWPITPASRLRHPPGMRMTRQAGGAEPHRASTRCRGSGTRSRAPSGPRGTCRSRSGTRHALQAGDPSRGGASRGGRVAGHRRQVKGDRRRQVASRPQLAHASALAGGMGLAGGLSKSSFILQSAKPQPPT